MEQQKDEKIIFCKGGGCTAKLGTIFGTNVSVCS